MAFRPMMHCVAALLVLLLVCCFGSARADPTEAQIQATYTFLKNFASGIPVLASEWTGDTYEGWGGVTVGSDGSVDLYLRDEALSGSLITDMATQDGVLVTSIDLAGNPDLYGRFDDSWAKLTLLEELDLSSTGFYGNIPSAWSGMVSLKTVKISNVQACGGLPSWDMVSLQSVDLSNAALRGALASSWSAMTGLTSVDLSGNSFCACEPDSWKANPVLHNAVSGMAVANSATCSSSNLCVTSYICYTPTAAPTDAPTTTSTTTEAPTTTTSTAEPSIPSHINAATLHFLKSIAVGIPLLASEWVGEDYEGWGGITVDSDGYVHVDVADVALTGTIANSTAVSGTNIVTLTMAGNPELKGFFDDSWAKLTLLEELDLSSTGLYGYIPSAWSGMVSLRTVNISNVQACGGLPSWDMVSLQSVDLSNAALRGALASSWSAMTGLTSVDLSGNSFCACEPSSWKANPVLHNAVSGMAVANSATCGPSNLCTTSYICYTGVSTTSSAPTTTSTLAPNSTNTTSRPSSAALSSAAVAFCVTLATLAIAALVA